MTFLTIGIVAVILLLSLWVRYEKRKQSQRDK